jgi:hypothetical protein
MVSVTLVDAIDYVFLELLVIILFRNSSLGVVGTDLPDPQHTVVNSVYSQVYAGGIEKSEQHVAQMQTN